jgi:uncharacterized protein (DUF1684 family)
MRSIRYSSFAALLLLCVVPLSVRAQQDDRAWREDLLKWRAAHAADLQAPERWLSLIALDWLKDGDNSFGADKSSAIAINAKVPAHVAVFRLDKGKVSIAPPAGGFPKELTVDGKPAAEQTLRPDDQPPRSKVAIGSVSLIVIHRGDRFALRVWDATAPSRTNFKGLHWYEPQPKYRVKARWIPYTPPKQINIPTVLGTVEKMPSPGAAEFELNGKTIRIEPVLEEPDAKDLFFIVRDTTSQSTTYGAGRFLYTGLPSNGLDKPGELLIDLNRMENPPCAYTPYATCPLPPKQNRMPIAIPAGEKRFHD